MDDQPRIELRVQPAPWRAALGAGKRTLPPRMTGMMLLNTPALMRRAMAAYYRSGGKTFWETLAPPSESTSGIVDHNDLLYLVLRNDDHKTLAVYRIRNSDQVLKRLR